MTTKVQQLILDKAKERLDIICHHYLIDDKSHKLKSNIQKCCDKFLKEYSNEFAENDLESLLEKVTNDLYKKYNIFNYAVIDIVANNNFYGGMNYE